jgi:hypothetical protein
MVENGAEFQTIVNARPEVAENAAPTQALSARRKAPEPVGGRRVGISRFSKETLAFGGAVAYKPRSFFRRPWSGVESGRMPRLEPKGTITT